MTSKTKEQALSIILNCAKLYEEHLNGKNLLFILSDKHLKISYLEVSFHSYNFLHLTGVKLNDDIKAIDFYERCLNRRLSIRDFELSSDGTTQLKLAVLPSVVCKNLSANMIGDYNGINPKLYTEKLAGGINACMGFVNSDITQSYVPNTILNVDIRSIAKAPLRVISTYRKNQSDEKYTELVYKAKKLDWSKIVYPDAFSYIEKPD